MLVACRLRPARRSIIAVSLLMLALAGCAPWATGDLDRLATLPQTAELTEVPFFPQEAWHCGPAALATVLAWNGVAVTPEALAPQVYLPKRHGSLQLELLGAARRYGSVPYVLAPKLEALVTEVAAGHPVIVLQNLAFNWYPKWHYAVVVGFDHAHGEVVLRSGARRRHVVPLATFMHTWRRAEYWALAVLAPPRLPRTADEAAYLDAVVALERSARADIAAAAYAAAVERWPRSLGAHLGLGNSRAALGDVAGAEAAFRAAIATHPTAADAFNNLAHVLLAQGRHAEARAAAQHALELGGRHRNLYQRTLDEIEAGATR